MQDKLLKQKDTVKVSNLAGNFQSHNIPTDIPRTQYSGPEEKVAIFLSKCINLTERARIRWTRVLEVTYYTSSIRVTSFTTTRNKSREPIHCD